jgi:hypothetical protein
MKYEVGMIIETKKPHVCQNNLWIVIRTGADIKIKCQKCNREIMLPKEKLDKIIKKDN